MTKYNLWPDWEAPASITKQPKSQQKPESTPIIAAAWHFIQTLNSLFRGYFEVDK